MKEYKINFWLVTFFLLLNLDFALYSQSQRGGQLQGEPIGTIRGRIVDDETGQPMEFVSVQLYRSRDSSLVNGALSNSQGFFEITKVPFGRYYLQIKLIGYKSKAFDSIFVLPRNPDVNVGTILFENEVIQTKEVEVTAQKDIVSYQIDRRIYDVGRDLTVSSGSAVDVLANVPSVSVDIDGNVSLRGTGNVTILIDGKPSALLGFDRTSVLEQIPADNIERIEVITNPSAKFDPDGVAGIINIVLKKNTMLGYGAIFNLNAGTADKYNASINSNLRAENFNTTFGYSFRQFSMRGSTDATRNSFAPDSTFLSQLQNFLRRGFFHRGQFALEWTPNTYNSLTFNANVGYFKRRTSDSTGYNFQDMTRNYSNQYYRLNNSEAPNSSYDLGLNFKRTFDTKEQELNANLLYTVYDGDDEAYYNQFFIDTISITPQTKISQKNKTQQNNKNLIAEVNYVQPFPFGRLEAGLKSSLRTIDIDYSFFNYDTTQNNWILNTSISNNFIYNENIYAGYLTFSSKSGNFGYQIGLRSEYASTSADQKTSASVFKKDYFNIFPTVHLSYQLMNPNSIMFSYSRRVNRPSFMALNPFVDYSDPQNLSKGNPELKPEYVNSFEITDLHYLPKGSLNFTIFYRYTTDIISRVTRLLDSNITETSYENLNRSNTVGFEIIWNQSFFDWWKLNWNFSYFYLDVNGVPQYGVQPKNSRSWNTKLNSIFNIAKNIDLQLNMSYDSPVVTTGGGGMYWRFFSMGSVGHLDGIFTASLALKIDLLNERATINFRIMDLFKTINYNLTTDGSNFTSQMNRTRESRIAFLGFQYKLNEYKRPKIKRPEEPQDFELE